MLKELINQFCMYVGASVGQKFFWDILIPSKVFKNEQMWEQKSDLIWTYNI